MRPEGSPDPPIRSDAPEDRELPAPGGRPDGPAGSESPDGPDASESPGGPAGPEPGGPAGPEPGGPAGPEPGGPEDPDPEQLQDAWRSVRRRVHVATWLGAGSLVALSLTGIPVPHVLGIPAFYVLLPALSFAQLPLLGLEKMDRIPVYVGSMVTILGAGAVAGLLAMSLEGVAPAGFTSLPTSELLLWTGGVTAVGLLMILASARFEVRGKGGGADILRDLLPRTRRERGLFAALSFSAGVGEELAYRAYAYQAIQLLGPGPWAAAVLASLPFGILHAYQGVAGVARTAAMGMLLAVPVVVTGSLLPSMAAHTLIDLLAGLVIGPRLLGGALEERPGS